MATESQLPAPNTDAVTPASVRSRFWRRRLATHNPLYAVSAMLVFYGLRVSFRPETTSHAFVLMACLGGYAAMLTVTAVWLRRLGTLWEDVRMIALLALLFLLAVSVTFDQTLLSDAASGAACVAIGWGLAVTVCESLFWGLKVRLPFGYRLPFHALLGLLFFYPLQAARQVAAGNAAALNWTLLGFPAAAALVLLLLLPAVARGPQYVAKNGTPWRWPAYPCTLFFFLFLGVVGRTYYLCFSFLPAPRDESIFGSYFLVPPLFSVGTLLLVGARLHGRLTTASVLLWAPVAWLAAASTLRGDDTFELFLADFVARFGVYPVAAALYLTIAFYAIAFALRTPRSFAFLTGSLLLAAVVHGGARSAIDWQTPLLGPIAAAGVLKAAWGWYRRDVRSCLVAVGCGSLCAGRVAEAYPQLPQLFITVHAILLGTLVVGALFRTSQGQWIRFCALLLLFVLATHATAQPHDFEISGLPRLGLLYPLVAAAAALSYAGLCREPFAIAVGVTLLVEWCGLQLAMQYAGWRTRILGLDAIVLGLLCFAVAVVLSYSKARRLLRETTTEAVAVEAPPPS